MRIPAELEPEKTSLSSPEKKQLFSLEDDLELEVLGWRLVCRGDLQACSSGGDKEQTVSKVVIKLAVAKKYDIPMILNYSVKIVHLYFSLAK